jgi:hypothetical protein
MREPASVVRPSTSKRFFTAKGTPARGPGSSPAATRASTAAASRRAASASTAVKQLSSPLRAAMRASAASVIARALAPPRRTVVAMPTASSSLPAPLTGGSSRLAVATRPHGSLSRFERRRRLHLLRQRKLHHEGGGAEKPGELLGHGRHPRRRDG